jgi:deoxyhypusine synthase
MQTLTYVNLSTIIDALGLTEEQIADMMEEAFAHVSYGDAAFTLVSANDALGSILWGLEYAEDVELTNEHISTIVNLVVGQAEYVNLEA